MAIKLSQGFQITSQNPIDTRLLLTKEEMKAIDDRIMPAKYFALCIDDNCIYAYDKSAEPNDVTGKFSLVTSKNSIIRGYYYNNNFYIDNTHTVECEKNIQYIYVDKHELGAIYTWDGSAYISNVKLDNQSLSKVNGNIEMTNYNAAAQGQIPTKDEEDGLVWIDPNKPLNRDEIFEILQ